MVFFGDLGTAYLKGFIVDVPQFGNLEEQNLVISNALYGLRSNGAPWHDRLADCMQELGFFSCKAEPDIWVPNKGMDCKYIAVFLGDLEITMKNFQELNAILEGKYKFKTKDSVPLKSHLP
jgi:Reverse transcriptase (RNA-dependent DNA polymerase)